MKWSSCLILGLGLCNSQHSPNTSGMIEHVSARQPPGWLGPQHSFRWPLHQTRPGHHQSHHHLPSINPPEETNKRELSVLSQFRTPEWLAFLLIHSQKSQKYHLGWHHCWKIPLRERSLEQSASSKPRALRRAWHSYYTNINTNGRDTASGCMRYQTLQIWRWSVVNTTCEPRVIRSGLEVVTNFGKGDWVVNRCNPLPPPYALQKLPCP